MSFKLSKENRESLETAFESLRTEMPDATVSEFVKSLTYANISENLVDQITFLRNHKHD